MIEKTDFFRAVSPDDLWDSSLVTDRFEFVEYSKRGPCSDGGPV